MKNQSSLTLKFQLHYFNPHVAEKYGIVKALLINYLQLWVEGHKNEGRNHYDGKWWTYHSLNGLSKRFGYIPKGTIRDAIRGLCEGKDPVLTRTNKFNKRPGDRTYWYSFTKEEIWLSDEGVFGSRTGCSVAEQGVRQPSNVTNDNHYDNHYDDTEVQTNSNSSPKETINSDELTDPPKPSPFPSSSEKGKARKASGKEPTGKNQRKEPRARARACAGELPLGDAKSRKKRFSGDQVAAANRLIDHLNAKTQGTFAHAHEYHVAIIRCLSKVKNDIEGCEKMISREAERCQGTPMQDTLTPTNLFSHNKFRAFYDMRDKPIIKNWGRGGGRAEESVPNDRINPELGW